VKELELRIPPPLITLIFVIDMWILDWLIPVGHFELVAKGSVSLTFLIIGLVLPAAGVLSFRRHQTTVLPMKPEKTTALVTTGIYRLTRNPMYLGMLFILVAWGIWLGHIASLLMLPLFVWYLNRFQIKPEERALQAKFGNDFTQFCREVRRWL